MTARLLPSFLDCFKDDHISVRLEAIAVSFTKVIKELNNPHVFSSTMTDPTLLIV